LVLRTRRAIRESYFGTPVSVRKFCVRKLLRAYRYSQNFLTYESHYA